MSEIKCNKLEITSLRQCDSIKIRGNIGPCIIEGPARQDSCQACQPCCSYWIWPVTHTQISPVKITGYIDFLFLFVSACERAECVSVYACAYGVGICVSSLHACVHIVYCTLCTYSNMYTCLFVSLCYICGCTHVSSAVRAGYKSGVGAHTGVRAAATSGTPIFECFRC